MKTKEEMVKAYNKRRQPRTEEHKQKIREGNLRFWALARAAFEEQQKQKEK